MRRIDDEPWEELKRSILAIVQWLAIVLAALVVLELYTIDRFGLPARVCVDARFTPATPQ